MIILHFQTVDTFQQGTVSEAEVVVTDKPEGEVSPPQLEGPKKRAILWREVEGVKVPGKKLFVAAVHTIESLAYKGDEVTASKLGSLGVSYTIY